MSARRRRQADPLMRLRGIHSAAQRRLDAEQQATREVVEPALINVASPAGLVDHGPITEEQARAILRRVRVLLALGTINAHRP